MIDLSKNFQPNDSEKEKGADVPTEESPNKVGEKFEPQESAPMVEDMFAEDPTPNSKNATPVDYSTGSAERVAKESAPRSLDADDIFEDEGLSGVQKIILIVVAVLVVAALATGGYFLYGYLNDEAGITSTTNTNKVTNVNSILNQNTNTNTNLNQAVDNINLANINVEDLNVNITQKDSDGDGLIDADELLYGSDMTNNDSDGDGYLDGEEVESGYDPMGPGKLIE